MLKSIIRVIVLSQSKFTPLEGAEELMHYTNYPYGIFNTDGLNTAKFDQYAQQLKAAEQQKHVLEMVKAISDYCEAARQVEPEYQQVAITACLIELIGQMNRR